MSKIGMICKADASWVSKIGICPGLEHLLFCLCSMFYKVHTDTFSVKLSKRSSFWMLPCGEVGHKCLWGEELKLVCSSVTSFLNKNSNLHTSFSDYLYYHMYLQQNEADFIGSKATVTIFFWVKRKVNTCTTFNLNKLARQAITSLNMIPASGKGNNTVMI